MTKLSASEIKEQKKETVTKLLISISRNSHVDRFGNIKFCHEEKDYRYKIKQNVIRLERKIDSLKEWRLVKSYNLNKVYKKAINMSHEDKS